MYGKTEILHINGFNVCVGFLKCSFPLSRNRTLLINGALATAASFRNWVNFLTDKSDVITFDLPFSGSSKPFNGADSGIVTLDDEVSIIEKIISVYKPNIIASVSWGGAATLKLLKAGCFGLQHAIIASYSFEFNEVMQSYVSRANQFGKENRFEDLASLMNDEVGFYLPKKMKFCNFRHLTSLDEIEYKQGRFHLEQISNIQKDDYRNIVAESPCQFHFINGELDRHTPQHTIKDACSEYENTRFYLITDTGHFLDLESKESKKKMSETFTQIFSYIDREEI